MLPPLSCPVSKQNYNPIHLGDRGVIRGWREELGKVSGWVLLAGCFPPSSHPHRTILLSIHVAECCFECPPTAQAALGLEPGRNSSWFLARVVPSNQQILLRQAFKSFGSQSMPPIMGLPGAL